MDLSSRKKSGKVFADVDASREKKTTHGGMYYTSSMQSILATKEANETKAANLVVEYLMDKAEETYDEAKVKTALNNMLNGFTDEEKLRIVSSALIHAVCKVS